MIKVNWIFIKLKLENLCDLGGKLWKSRNILETNLNENV